MSRSGGEDLDWLYRRLSHGIKPGLAHVRAFLDRAEINPTPTATRFIHVAGTNGKGSVCALIHALLRAHGQHAARFTSPHLLNFNERFRIDDHDADPALLAVELRRLRRLIESWSGDPSAPAPTFFEITFALALRLFEETAMPWAVLETGMGGRLDATNVVTPVVSAITPIAMDHAQYLGDTLEKIAAEKAGIIKPGVPGVSSPQEPGVMQLLRTTAERLNAPFTEVTTPRPADEPLALTGDHHRMNAAVAVAAFQHTGIPLDEEAVLRAFTRVDWPARFQRFPGEPPVIVDGAHNPHAMRQLTLTWTQQFPGRHATVLLGVAADKDIDPILRELQPVAARWIVSQPPPPRGLPAAALADRIRSLTGPQTSISVEPDPVRALARARTSGAPILATGSLFFAAEILATLNHQTITRPTSAQ